MAETLWRTSSKEHLINFPSYFDTNKPRMKRIVSQLDEIWEETIERKDDVPRKAKRAAVRAGGLTGVGAAAAAAGGLFAPFTGGLSVAAAAAGTLVVAGGAAALTAAGVVVVYDIITDKDTLEKVKKLITEFCDLVQPLRDVHTEKREMFEKLDRKVEEILRILQTLIEGLFLLFIDFKVDSTVDRLLEVTKQCRLILKELEELAELVKLEELKKL